VSSLLDQHQRGDQRDRHQHGDPEVQHAPDDFVQATVGRLPTDHQLDPALREALRCLA
jgi:hypothetical protein